MTETLEEMQARIDAITEEIPNTEEHDLWVEYLANGGNYSFEDFKEELRMVEEYFMEETIIVGTPEIERKLGLIRGGKDETEEEDI